MQAQTRNPTTHRDRLTEDGSPYPSEGGARRLAEPSMLFSLYHNSFHIIRISCYPVYFSPFFCPGVFVGTFSMLTAVTLNSGVFEAGSSA